MKGLSKHTLPLLLLFFFKVYFIHLALVFIQSYLRVIQNLIKAKISADLRVELHKTGLEFERTTFCSLQYLSERATTARV